MFLSSSSYNKTSSRNEHLIKKHKQIYKKQTVFLHFFLNLTAQLSDAYKKRLQKLPLSQKRIRYFKDSRFLVLNYKRLSIACNTPTTILSNYQKLTVPLKSRGEAGIIID